MGSVMGMEKGGPIVADDLNIAVNHIHIRMPQQEVNQRLDLIREQDVISRSPGEKRACRMPESIRQGSGETLVPLIEKDHLIVKGVPWKDLVYAVG